MPEITALRQLASLPRTTDVTLAAAAAQRCTLFAESELDSELLSDDRQHHTREDRDTPNLGCCAVALIEPTLDVNSIQRW